MVPVVRKIRIGGQGVTMWTPRAETTTVPPPRDSIKGWTKGAARRNRNFLLSVDPIGLSGDRGYALTLTIGETPANPETWQVVINRFFVTMRRAGMIRYHCVTEWTKKGRPHLHVSVYVSGLSPVVPDAAENASVIGVDGDALSFIKSREGGQYSLAFFPQYAFMSSKIIGPRGNSKQDNPPYPIVEWITDKLFADAVYIAWRRACDPLTCSPKAQHIERINNLAGWHFYVAKHCARGVGHYQRQQGELPDGWSSSGRLWSHGGSWPTRADELFLDDTSYDRMRRKMRHWLRARAAAAVTRSFGTVRVQKLRELRFLKRDRKGRKSEASAQDAQRKASSISGLSSFAPVEMTERLIEWAISHARAYVEDPETGEIFRSPDDHIEPPLPNVDALALPAGVSQDDLPY